MSRTMRGSKPAGFDFCTKRPGNIGHGGGSGKEAKRRTHKAERRNGSGKFQASEQDYWSEVDGL